MVVIGEFKIIVLENVSVGFCIIVEVFFGWCEDLN